MVGGNVLTSQRVTDVILKCFKAAAASQVRYTRGLVFRVAAGAVLFKQSEGCLCLDTLPFTASRCRTMRMVCHNAYGVRWQGCMNNLTFGDSQLGYYETIAGGAGAGPHWHGRSGVHTHMTNTRITDPEILERRYPVGRLPAMLPPAVSTPFYHSSHDAGVSAPPNRTCPYRGTPCTVSASMMIVVVSLPKMHESIVAALRTAFLLFLWKCL